MEMTVHFCITIRVP